MRALIIGLTAVSTLLAGCSSSTASAPTTSATTPSADQTLSNVAPASTAPPASGHYDVGVYLCTAVQSKADCPDGAVTAAQTAQVRTAIATDSAVRSEVFVDGTAALRVLARTNPKVAAIARGGDLPAGFLVELTDRAAIAPFRTRYSGLAGVSTVAVCGQNPNCDVATLRAVGVLH